MPMSFETWPSLPGMFFDQAARHPDRPFLWAKQGDAYAAQSFGEVAAAVRALARSLAALGIEPGERVALVSENRPEWAIADLAIMTAGAITVPTYTTNTSRDHRHILTDCTASAVVVSNAALARRLVPAFGECPSVRFVVMIEPVEPGGLIAVPIHRWDRLIEDGRGLDDAAINARLAAVTRQDTACLIYTSGTGGSPKGVMQRHEAIMHNCMGAHHLLSQLGLGDEVFLSFLPLSHSYEHTCGLYFPIAIAAQIYYAEGVETLAANLQEARPTILVAVPRLFEVMRERILRATRNKGGLRAKLFELTLRLGAKAYAEPERMSLLERLGNRLMGLLVRRKAAERFGGRLKAMISGGAPLNPEVGLFFTALGLRLLPGYGQTEAGPVVSCNPPFGAKLGAVGPPFKDVEVRIAEDGEILVRGPLVMSGYWGDPAASRIALRDGWLHTGDIGRIDADGHLHITDRKRDIIVLSGGDNVSPQRVEGILMLQQEIGQAMAFGDHHSYVVALLVPDETFMQAWAAAHGKRATLAALAGEPAFREAMTAAVERANRDLSSIERIKRFALADEPFSVDNGQMTPTLKVRRHKVLKVYRERLKALYRG